MDYISSWCTSERKLPGVTAVVTGCNTGIGKETALDLYSRGARVVMACRDIVKAEAARFDIEKRLETREGKGSLVVEQLDLSSLNSVRVFAARILEEPAIHILINNAGVMMCPKGQTEDGFETHMATNHFGHALLTLLLLPQLANSGSGRIVFVSSMLHQNYELDLSDIHFEATPYDPVVAYCRSKAANVLFARALARKLQEHSIGHVSTYSLHPGVIATDIGRHLNQSLGRGTTWLFDHVLSWFVKSPRCGAQTTLHCAVAERCAAETGLYYSECAVTSPSKQCQSDAVADEFWKLTIEALKLAIDENPFHAQQDGTPVVCTSGSQQADRDGSGLTTTVLTKIQNTIV